MKRPIYNQEHRRIMREYPGTHMGQQLWSALAFNKLMRELRPYINPIFERIDQLLGKYLSQK